MGKNREPGLFIYHTANFRPHQKELMDWFERNAPSLGEIYQGAVMMLNNSAFPGRIRFIAHAIREIRNRLPERVGARVEKDLVQYKNELDEVVRLWNREGMDERITIVNDAQITSAPEVSISRRLLLRMQKLIQSHQKARVKPEEAMRRMMEVLDPANDISFRETLKPTIKQWLDITDWFMKHAHDSGRCDNEVDSDELHENFRLFENALRGLLTQFYKVVGELDEILEDANA